MNEQLKDEIEKLKKWSKNLSEIPEPNRVAEWEEDYEGWGIIYRLFTQFIEAESYASWDLEDTKLVLYLIARNDLYGNILEGIVAQQPDALGLLASKSIEFGEPDARSQLADTLHILPDREFAKALLEQYLKDEEEYVRRMALMTIAKLDHPRIEAFCEEAWNRKEEWQEYQRIAVLHALKSANSSALNKYFELAMEDGREHLVANVDKLKELTSEA